MAHRPRKRFGQHFLSDPQVLGRLLNAIAPGADDQLIEIGPGLGALTATMLADSAVKQLTAIEIDRDCVAALQQQLVPQYPGRLQVIAQDALAFDFNQLASECLRVIGNLPYNISTPLLLHLLQAKKSIQDMHFMLQKEVVERITAPVGCKAYGRLSVVMQYACEVTALFDVPPDAFDPPPRVMSAVVRLVPHPQPVLEAVDYDHFERLVQQAFSQRRKMLRNTLAGWVEPSDFTALAIDPQARAETLPVEAFVQLSNYLKRK